MLPSRASLLSHVGVPEPLIQFTPRVARSSLDLCWCQTIRDPVSEQQYLLQGQSTNPSRLGLLPLPRLR